MCKYERDVGPASSGAPMGCSHSCLACVGLCCLGRGQQGAYQLFRLVPGSVVCCCRSPGEGKVTRLSLTSLGMWGSSCLAWWLCGCQRGLAVGRSPPFPAVSSGLTCLASHMGAFLGKSLRSLQAGSLSGPGEVQAGGSLPSPAVSLPAPSIFNDSSELSFITG